MSSPYFKFRIRVNDISFKKIIKLRVSLNIGKIKNNNVVIIQKEYLTSYIFIMENLNDKCGSEASKKNNFFLKLQN